MNCQGRWSWKILLALVMVGMVVGLALGQTRNGVWTHVEGHTLNDYTLWSLHDDKNHVLCYAVTADTEAIGAVARTGAAISCVKVEVSK